MSTAAKKISEKTRNLDEYRNKYKREFGKILNAITKYHKNPNLILLKKAFVFALDAHKDQMRKSGEPYITHCLETAKILAELRMDDATIAAGLLHDVVEDTGVSIEIVKDTFGFEIAQLVDGVTKIGEIKFKSAVEKQAENFRKMIFSMIEDLRVIFIKFADRLHNMRTLQYLPEKKAKRIALETREVYSPLAHRFGIARIKWELDDLAFKFLEPEDYNNLKSQIEERTSLREKYVEKVVDPIVKELESAGIKARVQSRVKSLYSVYRKMRDKNRSFEEVYDLIAIRIILKQITDCYFTLGVVHKLYTPLYDRFKDYIAVPKLNMYQSLHTTVVGPEGNMFEIQIRTEEMHKIAEIGIAAHWKYKEGKESEDELDKYSAWLREMIDLEGDHLNAEEYMDILKTNLYQSEVFVFTPKGDLIKLPIGSTPVDFGFAIHTDIGMHCLGAKVNGKIVPLNSKLKSGDTVEILTSDNQTPSQDWITFVKTSKAKGKIKRWFKETQIVEAEKIGREILERGLKRYRVNATKKEIVEAVKTLEIFNIEQLYINLGQGDISLYKVIKEIDPEKFKRIKKQQEKEELIKKFVTRARGSSKGIRVHGADNLLINFASCCTPVPGDPITGFVTKGRGIVVHRRDCPNAINLMNQPERNINVAWDNTEQQNFIVQLKLISTERKHLMKDVAEVVASLDTDIVQINLNKKNDVISLHMVVEVKDISHLTKIKRKLSNLKGVISVERDNSQYSE